MARRRWTEEQKAAALAHLEQSGLALSHRLTGVPKGTISLWAKQAGVQPNAELNAERSAETARILAQASVASRVEQAEELSERAMGVALRELGRLEQPFTDHKVVVGKGVVQIDLEMPPPTERAAIMRVIAGAVQISQLLAGEPTGRLDVADPQMARQRVDELQGEWRRRAEERASRQGAA